MTFMPELAREILTFFSHYQGKKFDEELSENQNMPMKFVPARWQTARRSPFVHTTGRWMRRSFG